MIECTDENIYYKTFRVKNRSHRKSKVKRFFVSVIVLILLGCLIFHINNGVFNLVFAVCEDYAYSAALSSINKSVMASIQDEVKYTDLIHVEKNKNGDISFMSSDALKINTISRIVAENTEKLLNDKLKEGVPVPLFAFTGIKLASGYGPEIKYYAITVVGVNCKFDGNFTSVGINQTLHSLYISVECKIDIEFLYKKKSTACSSNILISEAVLIGSVPEVYLNGGLFR